MFRALSAHVSADPSPHRANEVGILQRGPSPDKLLQGGPASPPSVCGPASDGSRRPAGGTGRVDAGSGGQVLSHLRGPSPRPELTQTPDLGWEARRGGGAYDMGFHSLLARRAAWGRDGAGSRAGFAGARGGATPMRARTPQTHSKRKRGLSGARSWSARRCPHEGGPGSPRDHAPAGAETHARGSNPSPSASSVAPQAPPLPGRQGACAGGAARQDAPPTPRKHALFF